MKRLNPKMNAAEMAERLSRHDVTWEVGAARLGSSYDTLYQYTHKGHPIPETVALLCDAIDELTRLDTRDRYFAPPHLRRKRMTRYILIDNNSGFIFGDSADLDGPERDETPISFARRLDTSIGEPDRTYDMLHYDPRTNVTGYHVYTAGTDTIPIVKDGQSRDAIDAVLKLGRYEGFIYCTPN